MGYRSEVAISLTEEDFNRLVEDLKNPCNEEAKMLFNHAQTTKECGCVTIYWDWVKWYEDFKEVQYFENFYRQCDRYKFIRVGEEYGDEEIIYEGDWMDNTEYIRTIKCYGDAFDCRISE